MAENKWFSNLMLGIIIVSTTALVCLFGAILLESYDIPEEGTHGGLRVGLPTIVSSLH